VPESKQGNAVTLHSDKNSAGEGLKVMAVTQDSSPVDATAVSAVLPLFAAGLGALGLLGWRRKRKALAA
jgi:hypothetical protein